MEATEQEEGVSEPEGRLDFNNRVMADPAGA